MTQCLLFDLFGTLVDYEADRREHTLASSFSAAEALGTQCSEDDYVETWQAAFAEMEGECIPAGREFLMADVGSRVAASLGLPSNELTVDRLVTSYMADWSVPIKPVTGVTGLLRRLARHYRLGLISNTHYPPLVHELLERMDLVGTFEAVILSADVGIPKPHPEIFLETCRVMAIEPKDAVYVGDSYENDYKGATSVGMDCYLIGRHARVPREKQLRSILDLPIHFNTHS